jgi:hypothetical protein
MGRDLPSALDAAIDAPVVRPFLGVRIETPDPVTVFTGVGRFDYADSDGSVRNWIGAGEVGAIDTVGEQTDGSATGIKCSLLKVPSEFRDDLADQAVRGVLMELYAGAFDETFQVVEAMTPIWKGRLDNYVIHDAGDTLSVEVSGESRAIDQRRPSIKRFTDEYQQRKHPGDKFFEYVPRMVEVGILWAKAEQHNVATGGGGGGGFGALQGGSFSRLGSSAR